ncbi:hypothetical protein GUITHDRAFT_100939 [Guillardia theta CCMP2712]|uniref:C2 domain-containing protein n=1 Tax=Guillardia theta (strain CCMP2712) TaxID=905079 RepID=L1JYS1_GUITC|nr:hypothetical protein GUITHDRAFT_100939 [Guillardia theta CCMP2712]EKX53233.1 hypothetical protein GUITHDRAFT_100939 [Guillardia theta CCMP2712]|eukprot:XP_005840213.1 hypothetical protein GUITHDRAFT_100939 [Guillardia theta CCMP2712]
MHMQILEQAKMTRTAPDEAAPGFLSPQSRKIKGAESRSFNSPDTLFCRWSPQYVPRITSDENIVTSVEQSFASSISYDESLRAYNDKAHHFTLLNVDPPNFITEQISTNMGNLQSSYTSVVKPLISHQVPCVKIELRFGKNLSSPEVGRTPSSFCRISLHNLAGSEMEENKQKSSALRIHDLRPQITSEVVYNDCNPSWWERFYVWKAYACKIVQEGEHEVEHVDEEDLDDDDKVGVLFSVHDNTSRWKDAIGYVMVPITRGQTICESFSLRTREGRLVKDPQGRSVSIHAKVMFAAEALDPSVRQASHVLDNDVPVVSNSDDQTIQTLQACVRRQLVLDWYRSFQKLKFLGEAKKRVRDHSGPVKEYCGNSEPSGSTFNSSSSTATNLPGHRRKEDSSHRKSMPKTSTSDVQEIAKIEAKAFQDLARELDERGFAERARIYHYMVGRRKNMEDGKTDGLR